MKIEKTMSENNDSGNQNSGQHNTAININVGHHEIIIGRRYGFLYSLNDILIAVWFIIGDILFFWDGMKELGIWLFLLGSIQLLIRPIIRICQNMHLKRINPSHDSFTEHH